jgi:hypothetical protein
VKESGMMVQVLNDKGKLVYSQWLDKRLISLKELIDLLEDFFIKLSGG